MKAFALIALLAVAAYGQTIVEVAESAGQFQTLLAAASAAGLVETLSSAGPFTVFAPTDDAFAALGQETIDNLLLPENREQLTSILLYHVVAGSVDSAAAEAAGSAASLQGGMLTFTSDAPGSLKVNGVTIIGANVAASNGLIHVIDQVLMPPSGGNGDAGNTPSMEDDMSESSSDDDDDSSSSDDDDDSSSSAMAPAAEPCEGESYEDVVAAAEAHVEEMLGKITAQLTRAEIKALKEELDGHVADLEARCEAACAPMDSDDDDDSSSDDDDDSSDKRKRSSSSDDDDDSSSYSDESDCRHEVNSVIREGKKDITKVYWSARSSSSDDDDDSSSSSDDDDDSSSS
jgi:uncharacterized surface protein with fasciclin (FAS1) repeats